MTRTTVLTLLVVLIGLAPGRQLEGYEFISPAPSSRGNSPESTIILRDGRRINQTSLSRDRIEVTGSKSGTISGSIILSSDGRTVIFKPDRVFSAGEKVEVTIHAGITTEAGDALATGRLIFSVAPFARMPNPYTYLEELRPRLDTEPTSAAASSKLGSAGFPQINVEIVDSTATGDGFIFLAVASEVEGVGYHLMMLNNDGTSFFSKELADDYAYDFKMQPNGLLTYAHFFEHHSYTGGGNVVHKIMDNSFTVVDSVQMGNGYVAEAHDFQMLPNGHYLLFGYYLTQVDMSQIVDGGQPDALVSGGVVQELDADKNVVFQWRSWDHYSFEDWTFNRRQATRSTVSAFHLNTINLDDDGHIFLATPSWVKKINRQTGAVIWSLGGADNEFSFVNVDSLVGIGLVGGHAFHRLSNGNVLLYDNGNRQGTLSSRVNEFRLDEESKTAELVWTYEPDSLVAGWHRGNAQRLPNGNTVIGWGGSSGLPSPAMTEVNAAGERVYELSFVPPAIESYRAFRFPFTGGEPTASVVLTEVAPGNTYVFSEGDSVATGVSIDVHGLEGTGYNELTVDRYSYAPRDPIFPGKAPRVQPVRMVVRSFGITSIDADVLFDIEDWNISDPDNSVVYHREFDGQGLFVPLTTSHNPAKQILVANTKKAGEFILTTADFESVVFTPLLLSPKDSAEVNQTLPLTLEWTPIGYVDTYDLQVSKDEAFADLIVDEQFLTDARYVLAGIEESSGYHWRVRASNDAGTSDWADPQGFSTTAPFVKLVDPTGGEELPGGLDFFIRWQDNIDEDVVLELHQNDALIDTIAITSSDGAYEWEVGIDLEPGPEYWIKIFSSVDNAIVDSPAESFSIVATTAIDSDESGTIPASHRLHQSYPNPFNPATTIVFELPATEEVMLAIYDMRGRRIATLIDDVMGAGIHDVSFDASQLPSGMYLYRLDAPGFSQTRTMVLVR